MSPLNVKCSYLCNNKIILSDFSTLNRKSVLRLLTYKYIIRLVQLLLLLFIIIRIIRQGYLLEDGKIRFGTFRFHEYEWHICVRAYMNEDSDHLLRHWPVKR